MPVDQGQLYRFEGFVLDTNENVLLEGGKPISLSPKALHLLRVLVGDHGRIVEKDRLMSEVWADSFVEDSNLTFTIRKLRQALNDDAHAPKFIETVSRRGYRFVAKVEILDIVDPDNLEPEIDVQDRSDVLPDSASLSRKSLLYRRPLAMGALFCGFLLILAGVAYGLFRLMDSRDGVSFAEANISRITSNGSVQTAVVSPDGKFLAYVVSENSRQGLWLKNVANGGNVQIELPSEMTFITNLAFAPDGDSVYFGHRNALYRFPVLGGVPSKIMDNYLGADYNRITFSPDGKQFAFLRFGQDGESSETASIVVYDTAISSERILASSKRPGLFLRSAAWSPDGKIIVCAALNADGAQEVLGIRVADGEVLSVPSPTWATIRQVIWRPDGEGLFVIGENDDSGFLSQLFSVSFPHGEAKNITSDLNDYQSLSITGDGRTVFAVRAQQESHIWVTDAEDAKKVRRITTGFQKFDGIYGINWTRDNGIVYETAPSGKIEIWSVNSDGSEARPLATEGGSMSASPDGRYIVFQSGGAAETGFFRLDWSQAEKRRLTTGTDLDPAFTPDGKSIVFTRYSDDVALWKVPVEGGEAKKLTTEADMLSFPSFSPDGNYIAAVRQSSSGKALAPLCIIDAKTGEIVKELQMLQSAVTLGHYKMSVQWSPDGKAIDYIRSIDGASNVWRQPIDGSPPSAITTYDNGLIFNFATSLDGTRYAFARGSYDRDVFSVIGSK